LTCSTKLLDKEEEEEEACAGVLLACHEAHVNFLVVVVTL
jgi:hypothetical protein